MIHSAPITWCIVYVKHTYTEPQPIRSPKIKIEKYVVKNKIKLFCYNNYLWRLKNNLLILFCTHCAPTFMLNIV
jgi:hypothetical protein